jgi:hypothetical protein
MSQINKKQIKPGSVDSTIVEDESLTGADILDETLTDADLSTDANIQLAKLNKVGQTVRAIPQFDGSVWSAHTKEYFEVYDSIGGQTYLGTITVNLDTVNKNSNTSVFSLSMPDVTINKTGTFFYSYKVTVKSATNTRTNSLNWLEKNTALIPQSIAYSYHQNSTNGESTTGSTGIVELTSGDTLRIRSQMINGSTLATVANGTSLVLIELL